MIENFLFFVGGFMGGVGAGFIVTKLKGRETGEIPSIPVPPAPSDESFDRHSIKITATEDKLLEALKDLSNKNPDSGWDTVSIGPLGSEDPVYRELLEADGTVAGLAKRTGLSKESVRGRLRRLRAKGLVEHDDSSPHFWTAT